MRCSAKVESRIPISGSSSLDAHQWYLTRDETASGKSGFCLSANLPAGSRENHANVSQLPPITWILFLESQNWMALGGQYVVRRYACSVNVINATHTNEQPYDMAMDAILCGGISCTNQVDAVLTYFLPSLFPYNMQNKKTNMIGSNSFFHLPSTQMDMESESRRGFYGSYHSKNDQELVSEATASSKSVHNGVGHPQCSPTPGQKIMVPTGHERGEQRSRHRHKYPEEGSREKRLIREPEGALAMELITSLATYVCLPQFVTSTADKSLLQGPGLHRCRWVTRLLPMRIGNIEGLWMGLREHSTTVKEYLLYSSESKRGIRITYNGYKLPYISVREHLAKENANPTAEVLQIFDGGIVKFHWLSHTAQVKSWQKTKFGRLTRHSRAEESDEARPATLSHKQKSPARSFARMYMRMA
ncbi:hypothetical protein EDD15DRAFT_2409851 [Pisolithus albus]|nr:hypothetical protein EDD15DRAFT_2409851 [Pisolithus albus]